MSTSDWLKSLKPGDEVIVDSSRYGMTVRNIRKVDKITPTGQIVVGMERFYGFGQRRAGWQISKGWHSANLIESTEAAKAEILAIKKRSEECDRIDLLKGRDLSDYKRERICAILDEPEPAAEVPE